MLCSSYSLSIMLPCCAFQALLVCYSGYITSILRHNGPVMKKMVGQRSLMDTLKYWTLTGIILFSCYLPCGQLYTLRAGGESKTSFLTFGAAKSERKRSRLESYGNRRMLRISLREFQAKRRYLCLLKHLSRTLYAHQAIFWEPY